MYILQLVVSPPPTPLLFYFFYVFIQNAYFIGIGAFSRIGRCLRYAGFFSKYFYVGKEVLQLTGQHFGNKALPFSKY